MRELRTFERNLASLRAAMHLVVNNFWNYFQVDIAQALWGNLVKALEC